MSSEDMEKKYDYSRIEKTLGKYIERLEASGFKREIRNDGFSMIVDNPIFSNAIRDSSHLHIAPKIVLRPKNIDQLRHIVREAFDLSIPLTFAGGKTGLSGGYCNPFVIVDMEDLVFSENAISINIPDLDVLQKNRAEENGVSDADNAENKYVTIKQFDRSKLPTVNADQNVLVNDLIRIINMETEYRYIFPIQPSSAYSLPVRVGGIISTNASGVLSVSIGATGDWLKDITIMSPKGEIKKIERNDPLFSKVVGGLGVYGVVLNATFYLLKSPPEMGFRVIFAPNLDDIFNGLQESQDKRVFPLISEFVLSKWGLHGQFRWFEEKIEQLRSKLQSFDENERQSFIKMAILTKGPDRILDKFEEILSKSAEIFSLKLTEDEFALLLEERTRVATQSQSGEEGAEYLQIPGYEDCLIEPRKAPKILGVINEILSSYNAPPVIYIYGHLNFRKGSGVLLHIRLPLKVSDIASNPKGIFAYASEVLSAVLLRIMNEFGIRPKAEHSLGFYFPWFGIKDYDVYMEEVNSGLAFLSPHYIVFMHVLKEFSDLDLDAIEEEHDKVNPADLIGPLTEYYRYYFGVKKLDENERK